MTPEEVQELLEKAGQSVAEARRWSNAQESPEARYYTSTAEAYLSMATYQLRRGHWRSAGVFAEFAQEGAANALTFLVRKSGDRGGSDVGAVAQSCWTRRFEVGILSPKSSGLTTPYASVDHDPRGGPFAARLLSLKGGARRVADGTAAPLTVDPAVGVILDGQPPAGGGRRLVTGLEVCES